MSSRRRRRQQEGDLDVKDYDFQCDDLSVLVNVSDFKRRCSELYGEVIDNHVSDHVSYPQEIVESCNTESLIPEEGLDQYSKGSNKAVLKTTKLQCLNQADTQKEYFERKGLLCHVIGEKISPPPPPPLPPPPPPPQCLSSPSDPPSGQNPSSSQAAMDTSPPAMATSHESMANPGEVVLSVFVYHPIKRRRDTKLLLLGCQKLTDIRDHIHCYRDYIVDKDYSENPDSFDNCSLITGGPTNRSTSAYFFINNTFYNDFRHPNSVNLSAPVLEWSRQCEVDKSPRLDRYQIADMTSTRVDQLSLRLGYPYLYCHHDNCQHLIVFNDLRLLHPTESHTLTEYPKLFSIHTTKRKLCLVCEVFCPRWVTLDDDMAPETPCLFCDSCFKKLHYTTDGKKMCNFRAYPYNPTSFF